ncbi:MAG: hypothetical protein R3222_07810 [Balneolaceae bacterium]|nr:hypothetical protein [Balneolaceae bacterium]
MSEMDEKELQAKLEISYIAVDLYTAQDGEFGLSQIADELDITVSDIFEYFPNKRAILEFFYTSLVIRYRMMIDEIDGFESYSLGEKLSNFAYASFDMMEEKQSFVESTYKDYIVCSYSKTEYARQIEDLLRQFFKEDEHLSASSSLVLNDLSFSLMRRKYQLLVLYWLRDESEGREKTMELIDKLTSFIQEVMYSKVADQGFELVKFFWSNISKSDIPFWDSLSSKIEIRE